jgi:hypothetical protein
MHTYLVCEIGEDARDALLAWQKFAVPPVIGYKVLYSVVVQNVPVAINYDSRTSFYFG